METVVSRNRPLADLLARASSSELCVLADIITDKGDGRVALSADVKANILKNRQEGTLHSVAGVMARELRRFGGNTVVNTLRSNELDYNEVVADVAKHLGGKVVKTDDVFTLEDKAIEQVLKTFPPSGTDAVDLELSRILPKIVNQLIQKSWGVERIAKTGGAGVVSMVASRITPALMSGPAAAVSFGASTLYEISGPAFRITVPAVIHIASIRRCQIQSEFQFFQRVLRTCL